MIYSSGNTRIAYDDAGSGPTVLFVHGHPFNRSMWLPQVEGLRGRARVITFDLRGYGDSPVATPGEPVTLDVFAADAVALLDELGIARATVVGLSMGGQIAMEIARAFPERVAGLVLAATFASAETPEGIVARNAMADRALTEGMAAIGCETLPKLIGPASMTRMPSLAANVYRMICSTDPRGAAAALRGRAMRRDYTHFLETVAVPAAIVVGSDDAYTTVEQAEAMHASMATSTLEVFEETGHMPNLERPERFTASLAALLERVEAQERA